MKVINDLYDYEGYKIVQDTDYFKFSLDSILLAEFVEHVDPSKKVLDLCTGNGVIPFLLSYYVSSPIVGFEIQKEIHDLAVEGNALNKLENQITFINDSVIHIKNYFPGNNFDVVVANPPYFKYQRDSIINDNPIKAMARHEISLSLREIFQVVKYALKEHGTFYLVHLPERLEEILSACEKYKIIAKKIQFVYTNENKSATMVLLKCVKGARNGLIVSAPLYIQREQSYKHMFYK